MSGAHPFRGRIGRLRSALGPRGPAAFLVTHLPNVRWLCGFTGSAGALLVLRREAVFLTDFRYRAQAAREVRGARRVEHRAGLWAALAAEVRRARARRLGFEAERLTVAAHADLAAALPGAGLVPLRGTVAALRAVKDRGEILAVRRALEAARRGFLEVTSRLAGRTELEVADRLRAAMRAAGAAGEAFPTIVASGPQGALPHAEPTARRIREGDAVVVDFGAARGGYASDVTRTLRVGKWGARARNVYRIVLEAQRAAIAAVKPGVPAKEVDRAARAVIEAAGFGAAFGHATGHGVGLEVHEKPSISATSGDVLVPGMVFTVEPGIYLEHFGGVRIEDMVLVTAVGCEVLSRRVPKLVAP